MTIFLENFTFIRNIMRKFEIDLIIQNILNLDNSLWFVLNSFNLLTLSIPDEDYIRMFVICSSIRMCELKYIVSFIIVLFI